MTEQAITDEAGLPFAKGYPVNVTARSFLDTAESLLITRAANRGILEVAIGNANVPLAGAMRRDILMPVLIDYVNFVIYPQADLQFDSALNDELTAAVASDIANEQQREPTEEDVASADEAVGGIMRRTPLFNTPDQDAGLSVRTELSRAAGMPLSVTLLMLDTALESAHNLSMKHQQETAGVAETEILDLTPVCDLLTALRVADHLNDLPRNVHDRLQTILTDAPVPQASPSVDQDLAVEATDHQEADMPETQR